MIRRLGLRARPLGDFLRDYLRFAGPRAPAVMLLMAITSTLEWAALVLLAPLLGVVTGGGGRWEALEIKTFSALGLRSPHAQLVAILSLYAAVAVGRAISGFSRDRVLSRLQVGFSEQLRIGLVRRLATARWQDLARLQHARVTQAINNDAPRLYGLAISLSQGAVALSMLVAATGAALVLAPVLVLLAAPVLISALLFAITASHGARTSGKALNLASRRMLHDAAQFLGGLKFALAQDLAVHFAEEQTERIRAMGEEQLAYMRRQSLARVLATLAGTLAVGTAVLVGFGLLHLGASALLAVTAVFSRMTGPAIALQQALQQTLYALPAYEALLNLDKDLGRRVEHTAVENAVPPDGAVVFDRVAYAHLAADGSPVGGVRDLSLRIEAGEFVALTGPSGAGKTTTADLLMGLLTPDAGEIRIGGVRLDRSSLPAWRERCAYAPQEPFISHDTLRANLVGSAGDVDHAALRLALRISGADALIARLPGGLDSVAGERGTLLSGGERQRLALARALMRGPRLLILDEATSALDMDSERLIFEQLRTLRPRPAALVISHRAQTLALCDRIVRLGRQDLADLEGLS